MIAYHPPKSVSHGHGSRVRGTRKGWAATQAFLQEQTESEIRLPLKLMIWGPSQWTDQAVVAEARLAANHRFGTPTSISGEFHNWELGKNEMPSALEFSFADDERPKQSLGPVSLYVSYSFAWRSMPNPPAAKPTQHFGRGNSIGVSVGGRRVFIQPTFLFAASDEDPLFRSKLRELEQLMPFVPNSRYYHRVEAKKSGGGEKLVKLTEGWNSVV